jgi:hypothetical protein
MRFLPLVLVTQVTKYQQVPFLASKRILNLRCRFYATAFACRRYGLLWQQRLGGEADLCWFYKGLLKRPAPPRVSWLVVEADDAAVAFAFN